MYPIRIWTGTEMVYPNEYTCHVDHLKHVTIIGFIHNNRKYSVFGIEAMQSTDHCCGGVTLYSEDIIRFKYDGLVRVGVVVYDRYTTAFCVKTNDGEFPLYECLCHNAELIGNTPEDGDEWIFANTQTPLNGIPWNVPNITIDIPNNKRPTPPPSCPRKRDIVVYTDGSCLSNPGGPGAWAYIMSEDGVTQKDCCYIPSCTNNQVELMAVINALHRIDTPANVIIYSDSKYVIDAFNKKWLENWKRDGWCKSNGEPVMNTGLWKELDQLTSMHNCVWCWVKGHSGNPFNEECDRMANSTAANGTTITQPLSIENKCDDEQNRMYPRHVFY